MPSFKRLLTTASVALAVGLGAASCDNEKQPPEPKAEPAKAEVRVAPPMAAVDRDPQTPADAAAPDAPPAAEVPPVAAAPQEPAAPTNLVLLIDDRLVEFPAARLHLTRTAEGVSARLYSDDPDEAIRDNYTGNSFYLQMPLAISDPNKVDQSSWTYKAPNSDKSRKPDGIYLDGTRTHLQPFDVEALFEREGAPAGLKVEISGQFLTFDDADAPGTPRFVTVWGRLPVTVDEEE